MEAVATKELFGPVVRFWRRFQTGRERSIDKHLELLAPGVRVFHEVQRHGQVAEIVPDDEHGKLDSKPYRVLFDTGEMHAYSAASAAKLRVVAEDARLAPGVRVFHEVRGSGRVAEIVPDDEHGKLNSKPYRVLFDTGAMHAYSAASAAKLRVDEERILADVPDDANTDASQVPTGRPHAPPTMAQQEVAVEVAGVATSFDASRSVEPMLLAEWQAEALTDANNESHTSCLAPQATETASGVSSEELLAVAAIADPSVGTELALLVKRQAELILHASAFLSRARPPQQLSPLRATPSTLTAAETASPAPATGHTSLDISPAAEIAELPVKQPLYSARELHSPCSASSPPRFTAMPTRPPSPPGPPPSRPMPRSTLSASDGTGGENLDLSRVSSC
jgi:hypothetical protein